MGCFCPKYSDIQYVEKLGSVYPEEPLLLNQPVTKFIKFILDRLICFVEEIVTYCLKQKVPNEISFSEIPLANRNLELPIRFKLTVVSTDSFIWSLHYDEKTFEEK